MIVETGCIRSAEDWSAGYATYLVGYFLHHHGGELHSVDNDPNNVAFARAWTAAFGPPSRFTRRTVTTGYRGIAVRRSTSCISTRPTSVRHTIRNAR